ncbi:UNVERIFIED_ORG: hypothetical protein J2W82_001157 [Pseudomonas mohnii]|nr:hypothetical protein [Pseudomonas mohnii]
MATFKLHPALDNGIQPAAAVSSPNCGQARP